MDKPLLLVTSLETLKLFVVPLLPHPVVDPLLALVEVDVTVLLKLVLTLVPFNKVSIGSAGDKLIVQPLTLEVRTTTPTLLMTTPHGLSIPTGTRMVNPLVLVTSLELLQLAVVVALLLLPPLLLLLPLDPLELDALVLLKVELTLVPFNKVSIGSVEVKLIVLLSTLEVLTTIPTL